MIIEFMENASKLFLFDKKALKNIEKNVSWKTAYFSLLIISSISFMISFSMSLLQEGVITSFSTIFIFLGALFSIVFSAVSIFISSGLVHLLLKIVGGKAKYLDTLKIYASVATISSALSLIVVLLSFGIPSSETLMVAIVSFIIAMISTSIALWALIASIISLARLHNIPYIKSIIALIVIPLLFIIIIVILIVLIALGFTFLI